VFFDAGGEGVGESFIFFLNLWDGEGLVVEMLTLTLTGDTVVRPLGRPDAEERLQTARAGRQPRQRIRP
jgi:hypothetical protein